MNDQETTSHQAEIARLQRALADAKSKIAAFEAEMAALSPATEPPISAEEITIRHLISKGYNRQSAQHLLDRQRNAQ